MNDISLSNAVKSTQSDLATPWSSHPVLDPDTQQFLDLVAESGLHPDTLLAECPGFPDVRNGSVAPVPDFPVSTDDLTFPVGPTGSVSVRIVRPRGVAEPMPAVIYFPGGGWRVGSFETHGRLVSRLAVEAEAAVVFVAYSAEAEARFPTQNEQAYAALQYVVDHADELRIDGGTIAVAGDGAGGNMAAVIAHLIKERRGPQLRLQALFCPILSTESSSSSYRQFASGPGMSARALQACIDAQFPPETRPHKMAMPILAKADELEDLPAALIITAENDVLRDDAETYARNLMRAGVRVDAVRYLGTIHDFVVFDGLADSLPSDSALRHACSVIKHALRS